MRITADTNVLLRALVGDDPVQEAAAIAVLDEAERVAIPSQALCELVWVLLRSYGVARGDVAGAIRDLMATGNVELDRPAAEAGLAILSAGGDFADGVIAHDGRRLGGETFVSFDKAAVNFIQARGGAANLVG